MRAYAVGVGLLWVVLPGSPASAVELPGRSLPEPPRQHDAWTPPQSGLPATFVSAVGKLFDQGLPDPRGCEYRMVRIRASVGELDALDGKRVQWTVTLMGRWCRETAFDVPAWVLPRRRGERRYAIQWNGVIYPVERIGRRASLLRHVERVLEDRRTDQRLDGPILRACLLLRLGHGEQARRAWEPILGEYVNASTQYDEPTQQWLSHVRRRALLDHVAGRDSEALARLEMLQEVSSRVIAEARARGGLKGFGDEDTALVQRG